MKRIYEEPTIETLIIDGTVIVSISGGGNETDEDRNENREDFDKIFNF